MIVKLIHLKNIYLKLDTNIFHLLLISLAYEYIYINFYILNNYRKENEGFIYFIASYSIILFWIFLYLMLHIMCISINFYIFKFFKQMLSVFISLIVYIHN